MAIEEDLESCGSRAVESLSTAAHPRQQRQKYEVYSEVLRRIQDLNYDEATLPGFDDQLWLHFNRLPARYALDVNVERAEDVLTHKRLLHLAEDPANRPVFEVRVVQVYSVANGHSIDSVHSDSSLQEDAQSSYNLSKQVVHPPPTFGSYPNLEVSALQSNRCPVEDGNSAADLAPPFARPMHEITFSTVDKPKLLTQLTSLLGEIGLNIQEAHAFSTADGFSLDVFVVDGWPHEETEELKNVLQKEILKSKDQTCSKQHPVSAIVMNTKTEIVSFPVCIEIPTDGTDVWEIDMRQLKIENKVASGSYGDLYKGTYCSQEVAIKVLKPERVNKEMLKEFSQEVYIMRKIRHKNVVQFIGACTRPPNLCIVTEFMARGSIYDFLHKEKGVFKLPSLLKVAVDVSKGMNYLHQNNIIHRDLKTANLLMDENEVVKVADFGVARVQAQSGVMTAETGTYRWMAPEVAFSLIVSIIHMTVTCNIIGDLHLPCSNILWLGFIFLRLLNAHADFKSSICGITQCFCNCLFTDLDNYVPIVLSITPSSNSCCQVFNLVKCFICLNMSLAIFFLTFIIFLQSVKTISPRISMCGWLLH